MGQDNLIELLYLQSLAQLLSNTDKLMIGSLYPTRDFSYVMDTIRGFELAIRSKNL